MTIPQFFVPNIHPQVIDQGGAPDPLALLLQGFQQGLPLGEAGYKESQQNSRSSAEIDIRKQELALQQQHYKLLQQQEQTKQALLQHNQEITKQQGSAFQELLPHLLQSGALSGMLGQGQQGQQPIQGPSGFGVQPQSLMMPGQMMAPGGPFDPSAGPAGAFMHALTGLSPEAATGFVHEALPLVKDQEGKLDEARKEYQKQTYINQAVASAKPEDQPQVRELLTAPGLMQAPDEIKRHLLPNLYGNGNESKDVDAFVNGFKTGYGKAGYWAQIAGVKIPKAMENMTYVSPTLLNKKDAANRNEEQASNYLTEMVAANSAINAFMNDPSGLPVNSIGMVGQMKKDMQANPEGFFNTGMIGAIKKAVVNGRLDPKVAQAVTAQFDFANAWSHLVGGARGGTNEMVNRILTNTTEEVGESPSQKRFKQNMRAVMIQGASDIAKKVRTPTQVIDGALRQNWSPEQRAMLLKQRAMAVQYENEVKAGIVSFSPSDEPPGTDDETQQQLDELQARLTANKKP